MNVRHLRPEHLRGLRWRAYIRESTDEQAQKWSPDRQRNDCARGAEELGLVAAEPTWYERTGTGEAESAELARALADARRGLFDVLLVLTTSRFARNRAEAVRMKAEFRRAGIPIYFVHERIVSGSRHAALLEGVKEVVDEEENEVRRMWIAGGQRERMLSGRWVGAIPFGYRKALVDFPDGTRGWDGGLAADEDRAPVLRRIFALFAGGTAPLDIAFSLNAEGVAGPQGPWSRATIVKLLRNPAYKGVLVRYRHARPSLHYYPETDPQDGRRVVDGAAVEPLVSAAEWDQVQSLLDSRVVAQQAQRSRRRYPLSLILRCDDCGRSMSGVSNGYSRYYRCSARAGDHSCSAPFIRADEAEGAFAEWIGGLSLPADWREAIVATHEPDRGGEEKRRRVTERLTRLRNLYSWGELDEAEYRAESTRGKAELAEIVEPSSSSMGELAERLRDLGDRWASAAAEQQTAVARLMLREIVVKDAAVVAFVARPEVRPLLELCLRERVAAAGRLYADDRRSTADIALRWSA
jgi:DNA invertase Pin-like site-specific DNA recombinase